jgi:Bacteriophage baseplate protein W
MSATADSPPFDFLGCGFAFPFAVTPDGRLARATDVRRIDESIWMILGTRPGERLMRPDFGCAIHGLLFAQNTPALRARAVDAVRRALVAHEPRIDVLDIRADFDAAQPSLLVLRIDYRVRGTNTVNNLVYPFYINESA